MVRDRIRGMDNYRTWKSTVKMALVLDGLYNCVTGIDFDKGRNQTAIAQIAFCMEPQCYVHLVDVQAAKETWENLEKEYNDKGLFRRISLKRRS